jgi:disulfide bond formation protein DsbB
MTKSVTGSIQSCSSTDEQISGITLAYYSLVFFMFMSLINIVFLVRRLFWKN